jgi:outer membrane receptor protein involved in Fe transport
MNRFGVLRDRRLLVVAGTFVIVSIPISPHAQEALPEIVVSAEKVDQNAQDVPASLTVLPRSKLDDAGINSVQDLAQHAPNLVLSDQGSPRFSVNTIRGIGSTVRDDYFNSSLGVYLDGVPLSNAEFNRRLGDIERVEILRGPQGTLYGHNTPAGIINLTSRAPSDTFKGAVVGTFGNKGQREGSAGASGPLAGPALTGRLFFDYAQRDGFTNYLSSGNSIDDLKSATGSGALRVQLNDRSSMTLSGSVEHVDQGAYAFQPFNSYRNRVLDITPPNQEVRDSRNMANTFKYDFGPVQFTSITGFRTYDVKSDQDLNYNPFVRMFGGGRTNSDETGRQVSQEVRLSGKRDRLSWIAGGFAQTDKVDFDYVFNMPAFGPASLSAASYSRRELAGFGEATWNVVGGLDLTAGIRIAQEHHDLTNNAPFHGTADFTLPTPKFRAAYRFDNEKLVYVSATRGARSGGFNRLEANDAYESEFLWSYEAGFKTEWLNRTVTLNGAAFYIDWTNQQIKSMVAPGIVEISNAGKSHSQGFELEASWRPVRGLELSGYVGVTHGEYDQFIGQGGTSLAGNRLVNTPTMTAGLASQYRWALAQSPLMGVVRAEYHYIGSQYFDPENRLEQSGYGLVNLRAGVENERFSAMVFVKNLLDTDYRSYGYRDFQGSALASDIAVAGQSRMYGITVSARY